MNTTQQKSFVLYGNIIWPEDKDHVKTVENGWLVCENGFVAGVFAPGCAEESLPEKYAALPLTDCSGHIIIPGLTDLHVHAPQYGFRGLGMDMELIDWLNNRAFPEEIKYADTAYAEKGYNIFVDDLKNSATTRAAIFATLHPQATMILMEKLEETGLCTLVGKVNMDRNSVPGLEESQDTAETAAVTENWIEESLKRFVYTKPVLTPRFIPSCTDELMEKLSSLQQKYNLPVQSHLSENRGEIEWVKELCPWAETYGHAYDHFGMFGGDVPTIMAHCVHPPQAEFDLLKERGVMIAHCPSSNTNLTSGIAPAGRYLDEGMPVGLGSDVAGGFDLSILRAMSDAVQVSKLREHFTDGQERNVTIKEAFFMGTKGGGSFFGKVGSFEEGFEFDAVVIDDSRLRTPLELGLAERLERVIYLEKDIEIKQKYVQGRRVI